MVFVSIKVGKIKFDARVVRKNIDKVARAALKNAARDFVDVLVQEIPVLTGMALGSVLPVARAVDQMEAIQAKLATAAGRPGRRSGWNSSGPGLGRNCGRTA